MSDIDTFGSLGLDIRQYFGTWWYLQRVPLLSEAMYFEWLFLEAVALD